jgi:hypothetical protein
LKDIGLECVTFQENISPHFLSNNSHETKDLYLFFIVKRTIHIRFLLQRLQTDHVSWSFVIIISEDVLKKSTDEAHVVYGCCALVQQSK